MTNEILLARMS